MLDPAMSAPIRGADIDEERLRLRCAGAAPFWIDIDVSDPRQAALLTDVFHFHPLAVEDTRNLRTRMKLETYDGYVFIVLRALALHEPSSGRLDVETVGLFVGANYLVSVHIGPSASVTAAIERVSRTADAFSSPARIAHAIGDTVIDGFFPIRDRVDAFVDRLERDYLSSGNGTRAHDILGVRRLALAARRVLIPQREIFNRLAHEDVPHVGADDRLYFRDVYDHTQRIIDSLDTYRELIATTTESHVAELSIRLNYATTVFSAIATVAIPFLIVSGLYGMNFPSMPLLHNPHGFWIVVAIQSAIAVLFLLILRARRLL